MNGASHLPTLTSGGWGPVSEVVTITAQDLQLSRYGMGGLKRKLHDGMFAEFLAKLLYDVSLCGVISPMFLIMTQFLFMWSGVVPSIYLIIA